MRLLLATSHALAYYLLCILQVVFLFELHYYVLDLQGLLLLLLTARMLSRLLRLLRLCQVGRLVLGAVINFTIQAAARVGPNLVRNA